VITRSKLARAAASVILAGVLVTSTAGCAFIANQATLMPYDPSDGVGADLETLDVRNAIGIINEEGDAISLLITFVNNGERSANVNVQFESDGEKTTVTKPVGAGATVGYGNFADEDKIIIRNAGVPAGDLIPVYVQFGDSEGKQLLVPVLEPAGPYVDLAPTAAIKG
jgi:hypothetical protein